MKTLISTCCCIIIFSMAIISRIQAQEFSVTGVIPLNQAITAPLNTEISVYFDSPVDPNTVNSSHFRVFGRWSGPMQGNFTFEDNYQLVKFTPESAFIAGEFVNVMISNKLKSDEGMAMPAGYAWGFWTATAPGILDQPFDYQVILLQPGEITLQTYGAYAGDLNNDGFSDLTIVNETSDDLRIMLNDGTGTFDDFSIIPMGNSTPSPSEGCDINNDGEIDLVVTTAWDNQVRTLLGHGDGNLTDMETYYNGDGARGVAVMDFNADGWDDFFVVNRLSSDITLLTNTGNGTFTVATDNTEAQGETAIVAADANQDGITDVFIASFYSNQIYLLLGDGQGGFEVSDKETVGGQPWMIAGGDFNGDGYADIASANSSGHSVSVIFGDGSGGLGNAASYMAPDINFPLALDAGDIDGDGDLDLVSSNYGSSDFTVFENNGLGVFTPAATLAALELSSCAILHDRDNDGDLDITCTDEGADAVIFYLNTGAPVGISESKGLKKQISIFPNPFTTFTNIAVSQSDRGWIEIVNMNGQVVRRWAASAGNLSWDGLDSHGIPVINGLYFVQLRDGDGRIISSEKIEKLTP